ncbi:tail fiber assembly protein [Yokenella regensburgei]|uniref:Bacteriophage tail assembly protein n=1 Tax=Yokenella regensburgei TaxID=158877 RepID=A0AB38FXZ7_9ENTR|nr:tail fiber assembly protein [Yokenella regensburgei]KFD25576.1 tail fiber assembly protein [Yokenella regensburgei ATCC 49455]SQA62894.1 Bacteriophage tail assembly protein [Yokenella regensburgei]SQA63631.1 Bacteriophage tail assembly protein [Yokenella regensburgei]SQA95403.1 Bacteriophage tail assembly protein [Yokenella regensburgei]SQB02451.1 Bacteriophage tail assembly protein [Yokenella regensburgei]
MTQAKLNSEFIATVAGDITVFNYDGKTREYLSSSVEYLPVGVGIPANSCTDAPGESKDAFAIFRTSDFNGWEYGADHRGETVYNTATGEKVTITVPGEYPEDTTTLAPATPYDKWNGSEWVTDTELQHAADVMAAEQMKTALLAEATTIIAPLADAQAGGYIDDADVPRLGEWQRYRYKLTKVDTSTAPVITLPPKPEV